MQKNNQSAKLLFMIAISLTVVFSACKKDKEDDAKTKTELLTASNWKMTASTVNPEMPVYDDDGNIIGTSGDEFAQMEPCFKDDFTKFNTDFTVNFDEGPTKCDDSDPQTVSGTWTFKSNETMLTVTQDGFTQDVNILELTSTTLKLQYSDSWESETYTFTITFTH